MMVFPSKRPATETDPTAPIAWPLSRHMLAGALLAAAVWACYGHVLNSPFIFDDYPNIVNNYFIRIENLSPDSIAQVVKTRFQHSNRKLVYLTFAINHRFGGYHPFGYHAVNIMIHILCGALAAIFFLQTLKPGGADGLRLPVREWLAWGAAFFWALHPIQITAVTYTVQRMSSLATLFALLTMILWFAGRQALEKRRYPSAAAYGLLAVSAWLLGLNCKETVAIVPLLILIHELFLIRGGDFRIKPHGVLIFLGSFSVFVYFYTGAFPWDFITRHVYAHREFTPLERLMTQTRVLWRYVSLFYFPLTERFVFLYDAYPLSRGLLAPPATLLSIVCWTGVAAAGMVYRRRWPVFGWTVFWFLAGHLVESTVLPLEILFEHRMYLPSLGLSFGLLTLGWTICSQRLKHPKIQALVLLALLTTVGSATYSRNVDFKDPVSLYRADLFKNPGSKRILLNLAVALKRSGNLQEYGQLIQDLALDHPDDIVIQANLHRYYKEVQRDDALAGPVYRHILDLLKNRPGLIFQAREVLYNMATRFYEEGDPSEGLFLIDQLEKVLPKEAGLLYLKGLLYAAKGEWTTAATEFESALARRPDAPPVLYWCGKSLIMTGRYDRGCALLQKASRNVIDAETAQNSLDLMRVHCGAGTQ